MLNFGQGQVEDPELAAGSKIPDFEPDVLPRWEAKGAFCKSLVVKVWVQTIRQ